MFIFFLCAVVLVVLALGFILPAMLGTHSTALTDQQDHNIAIARERLAQLKVDLANNTVTDEDYQETKRELEQTLADDLHDADAQSP
ncbi:MAG: c-type cytochrome biogenesis protein CcmI, partial [Gammaproteobacteria bacterium]|nr:c-type cytochrome biogenesis protein CcmI [Gammaproteobacteria bacterium]